jgi:hypothetical protein
MACHYARLSSIWIHSIKCPLLILLMPSCLQLDSCKTFLLKQSLQWSSYYILILIILIASHLMSQLILKSHQNIEGYSSLLKVHVLHMVLSMLKSSVAKKLFTLWKFDILLCWVSYEAAQLVRKFLWDNPFLEISGIYVSRYSEKINKG